MKHLNLISENFRNPTAFNGQEDCGKNKSQRGGIRDFKPLTSWLNINPVTLHESFLPRRRKGKECSD